MGDSAFLQAVSQARESVKQLDAVDGFADRDLGTILSALEAGLRNPESGAAFDAYVMLQDFRAAQKSTE